MTISEISNVHEASGVIQNTLVFIGSYTNYDVLPHLPRGHKWGEGIYTFRWIRGKLELLTVTPCLNPAFMKYHPKLNVLYVLSECIDRNGYVTAYNVDPVTGCLSELSRLEMTGRSTCYITFDKDCRHAIISNYWDAKLNVVELDATGMPVRLVQEHQQGHREEWRQVVDREDHWANRQDGPHAHCNVFHPSYNWLFVPDLGDNCIYQYTFREGKLHPQGHVFLEDGVGPRHFVFHPKLPVAYSGCELRSKVQVFALDTTEPEEVMVRVKPVQVLKTLPDDFEATNYVGEIKIDAQGKFVYVSNRGHNSIAVYAVNQQTGLLTKVAVNSTLGKTPRHFGFSPCGKYAVVGDQDSDVVKVFHVDPHNGTLDFTGTSYDIPTPNFVLFTNPILN